MDAFSLSFPGDTIQQQATVASDSYNPVACSLVIFPRAFSLGVTLQIYLLGLGTFRLTYPMHFDQCGSLY